MPSASLTSAERVLELPELLEWISESAASPAGRAALEAFLPTIGEDAWEERLRRGCEAYEAVGLGREPALSGLGELAAWAGAAEKRVLSGEELADIVESLRTLASLASWCAASPGFEALARSAASLPPIQPLLDPLERSVDDAGRVRETADRALGPLRGNIRAAHADRAAAMERMAQHWAGRGWLQQRQPAERGGRAVLAVKAIHARQAVGVLHDRSQSGETLFVEPAEVVELSNRAAALEAEERQIVGRVLAELSRHVARERGVLADGWREAGKVDAAFAAARWAHAFGALYPDRGEGVELELRGARHPLLVRRLGREEVVPLTVTLGIDWDLLVVTGPNTGGKTVALKTIGLLALLYRCGLPVTADPGTQLPFLSGVAVDIGDSQSINDDLSTFSGHMERVVDLLADVGPGWLVLLDELGTGTDPEEGAALGRALLETLQSHGALTVATTHLGSLKTFSTGLSRAENASMEFDADSLAPKYRLLVGVAGASHAIDVAAQLGLPRELIARARTLASRAGSAEALLADIGSLRREAELLRESARGHEQEQRSTLDRIEAKESRAEATRRIREGESDLAFGELQAALLTLLSRRLGGLRDRVPTAVADEIDELLTRVEQLLAATGPGEKREAFLRGVRKGDWVFSPKLRERVLVQRVDRKRERITVRNGKLEIELHFRDITWAEPPPGSS